MLTVGSPLSSALAALNAITPAQVQPAATSAASHAGNALTGASRLTLSPAAGDALLRINAHAAATKASATPARSSSDGASGHQHAVAASGVPADTLAWLDSLGAERWEVRHPPAMDDATFQKQVLSNLYKNGSAKLAGFAEARANGTLTISRADDVPELGYRSFQVTLYKDGEAYGGVGFSVCNTDHWMALRDSGIYAGTGSVSGTDYVVTWPMPQPAADSEPGTYAAA